MVFFETFFAVLTAQFSIWIIDRYIKKHFDTLADSAEERIKIRKNFRE